jgi:hypothetical protein
MIKETIILIAIACAFVWASNDDYKTQQEINHVKQ